MEKRASFKTDRKSLTAQGVPKDYIDALLDEGYVESLIKHTEHLNETRTVQKDRYILLNKVILVFLCIQAALGVWIALFKTVLQPDFIFSANAVLEDVDMVVMIDTSRHNGPVMKQQHMAVSGLSKHLWKAMREHRHEKLAQIQQIIKDKQRQHSGFMEMISPRQNEHTVKITGGVLRIATGVFNTAAEDSTSKKGLLHPFDHNLTKQTISLREMVRSDYLENADYFTALKECEKTVSETAHKNTLRFCTIIGDNEAMCKRRVSQRVSAACEKIKKINPNIPCEDQGLLEYSDQVEECSDFTIKQLNETLGVQLIMMFTVGSYEEEQLRLKDKVFQTFLQRTTQCNVTKQERTEVDPDTKIEKIVSEYRTDDDCVRFMMGQDFNALMEKSQRIAELLKNKVTEGTTENSHRDMRYLIFLLLPLNLMFYIFWAKVIQVANKFRTEYKRKQGVTKKMVKVTKTLVEKPRRDSSAQRFAAMLTEVEMSEMQSSRPGITTNKPMTMRARLKGGFISQNAQNSIDGNGTAFDAASNWTFDPVNAKDGPEGGLVSGQKMRIRNKDGACLRVTPYGFEFVKDADIQPDDAEASMFVMEAVEGKADDIRCRLGDVVRIKALGTDQYVRVHKDGSCDGFGTTADLETQIIVDSGGPAVASGGIVSLNSLFTGNPLHGTPTGGAQACEGGEEWQFWMIEKKEKDKTGSSTDKEVSKGNAQDGLDQADSASLGQALKVGDVVSLRGFNQANLRVDEQGRCYCGNPNKAGIAKVVEDPVPGSKMKATQSFDEEAAANKPAWAAKANQAQGVGKAKEADAAAAAPEEEEKLEDYTASLPAGHCQEFVIERVGMGLVKSDQTIRRGMDICLRPYKRNSAEDIPNYMRAVADGSINTQGRATGQDINFQINAVNPPDMVEGLSEHMTEHDVELVVTPLWSKADSKKYDGLAAPWTNPDEMKKLGGAVIVREDGDKYTIPKQAGAEHQGWVAVVEEGIDLHDACEKAKAQGANGVIVRCPDEILSLEKLSHDGDVEGPGKPCLPCVFVDKSTGEAFLEKGIKVNGQMRKPWMSDAMRALGSAAKHKGLKAVHNVFGAVGKANVELRKHVERNPAPKVERTEQVAVTKAEEDNGKFKWKIQSQANYFRGAGGGGAVNYGKVAPPSAQKKKLGEDGKEHVDTAHGKAYKRKEKVRTSIMGMAIFDGEAVKGKALGAHPKLKEVLTMDAAHAHDNEEQLAEDSDFKLEYKFEEMEVGVDEHPDHIAEDVELQELEGTAIEHVTVPARRFWLVAAGLLVSTLVIAALLHLFLNITEDVKDEDPEDHFDFNFDDIEFKQLGRLAATGPANIARFLSRL